MTFPVYTARERLADGCLHVAGLLAAAAAVVTMLVLAIPESGAVPIASLAIYGSGLIMMLGCSAAYNMTAEPGRKHRFRQLDHAAIFIMIAGTYTPFSLVALGGATGGWLLAGVWIAGLLGVAYVLLQPKPVRGLALAVYLAQGWAILLVLEPLYQAVSERVLLFLILGGMLYTVGVLFHLWDRLPFNNAIWHGFVLAAAGCHYWAVLDALALA